VTNVGRRPTFEAEADPLAETFVLNWSGDLYGDVVRVRFLYHLREERRFQSIEELRAQINKDITRAESYFRRGGVGRSLAIA
jgi:riboflavin kinase/FMN adenylyltransferase